MGRYLSDTIASIPKISPEAFDKLFNDSIQVTYLKSNTIDICIKSYSLFMLENPVTDLDSFYSGSTSGALSGQFNQNATISSEEAEFGSSSLLRMTWNQPLLYATIWMCAHLQCSKHYHLCSLF